MITCLHVLEAPGVPIEYTYISKGGNLTLSAESYTLDIRRGVVLLKKIRIKDPKDKSIAEVDALVATGLDPFRGADQIVRVRGTNIRAVLVRGKSGRFDFEDYLPETKGPPAQIPFEVTLDQCNVLFVDRTGPTEWQQSVSTPLVWVAGVGKKWTANATANLAGSGRIESKVQSFDTGALEVSGYTPGLELAPALAHFAWTPEGKAFKGLTDVRCKSFKAIGPFRISIPVGKSPNIETQLEATATNVSYGKYALARVKFSGRVDANRLAGNIDTEMGGTRARFAGSATWLPTRSVTGELVVTRTDSSSLPSWMLPFMPKGLTFHGADFHGWIAGRSPKDFHIRGTASAADARYSNETIHNASLQIDAGPNKAAIDIKQATYENRPVNGGLKLDLVRKTVQGVASIDQVDLLKLASRFGYHNVSGKAGVSAFFEGSLTDPKIQFVTHGFGQVSVDSKHAVSLGNFQATGQYAQGDLTLTRAFFDTPEGLITAKGSLGRNGNLGIVASGRGIQLGAYDPTVSGTVNILANIVGSVKSPKVTGRIEGFDLAYQDQLLPALVSNFSADLSHAQLTDLEAAKGTTTLEGAGEIDFKSGHLSGALSAKDIQIADWLGEEFVGAIDVSDIHVSGTVKNPHVEASVTGSSLVARGIKVDKVQANMVSDGKNVGLHDLLITGAGGQIKGSGNYDLSTKSGRIVTTASGLALDRLAPELSDTVAVEGRVGAQGTFDIEGMKLSHVNIEGTLEKVSVNGSSLGSGPWQVHSNGSDYTGGLEIGDLERYITLDNVTFNLDTLKSSGDLALFNIKAENLISASLRYVPTLSFDARESLQSIKGSVNLASKFNGTLNEPEVIVESLQSPDLSFRNQFVGELNSKLTLKSHIWDIQTFNVTKGPMLVSFSGTVDEHGETHIDGSKENTFDLSKLGLFDPRLSALTGTGHLWFSIDGPTQSPRIVASLKAENLFANPTKPSSPEDEDKNLRFTFDKIDVTQTIKDKGGLVAEGEYFYKGMKGSISATAPFEFPFKLGATGPAKARITFAESKLKDIAPLLGGIDANRSSGTLSGAFDAEGNASALKVTGALDLNAETLGFVGVEDGFKNVKASVVLTPNLVNVLGTAEAQRGGNLRIAASTPIEDLGQLISQTTKEGAASLLDRTVSGSITLNQVRFKQNVLVSSNASGTVSAEVGIKGTLKAPSVSGDVSLANGNFVFKGLPNTVSHQAEFPINPRFDVNLTLSGPTHMSASTANMDLLGKGSLKGSLLFPKATASLYVDKGTIRLPASLLRLDQGGTVDVTYQSTRSGTTASAIVDLEGNTSVTTTRTGDSDIQRYDITLGMKGDLLQEKGISLTASSDPPDLSQDRILGIMGQTSILQNLSNGFKQSDAVGAAAQFLVPSLLDPLTSQIAKGFGLDYINLEYNMFDQASVAFGKDLGSGFSIMGSRQLSEPPPGFPTRFDLRIVYRPRRLPGALRRIRFFFGADQERPWKLGLDYGIRF